MISKLPQVALCFVLLFGFAVSHPATNPSFPQWQQLLLQGGHLRWNERPSEYMEDLSGSDTRPRFPSLRASEILKALSDKRNFITQIRTQRFKDSSSYAPALTPSGRPYGTPLRWG